MAPAQIVLLCILPLASGLVQSQPVWDNTTQSDWPDACKEISMPSSSDSLFQSAYFYAVPDSIARPLVVSLHSWSGSYEQRDTLSWMCIERGYHYIHPHFRGPSDRPEACGSHLVIRDIEDAIAYARQHSNVDTTQIHVIGASGGGYATLLTYAHTRHPVSTFSAWVPITDLSKWYYESLGRGTKYAQDIRQATTSASDSTLDIVEARKRSPMYQSLPIARRRGSTLHLFAGIHDGYQGSVPITHSLAFYNKTVSTFDSLATDALVSNDDIIRLVAARYIATENPTKLGNRMVHYERHYLDQVHLIIFEGGHEMLPNVALDHIDP